MRVSAASGVRPRAVSAYSVTARAIGIVAGALLGLLAAPPQAHATINCSSGIDSDGVLWTTCADGAGGVYTTFEEPDGTIECYATGSFAGACDDPNWEPGGGGSDGGGGDGGGGGGLPPIPGPGGGGDPGYPGTGGYGGYGGGGGGGWDGLGGVSSEAPPAERGGASTGTLTTGADRRAPFEPPQAPPVQQQSGGEGVARGSDPLTPDGSFVETYVDLELASRSADPELAYRFERTYSSDRSAALGVLGYGWSHNYEWRIHPVASREGCASRWQLSSPQAAFEFSGSSEDGFETSDGRWEVRSEAATAVAPEVTHPGFAGDDLIIRHRQRGTEYRFHRFYLERGLYGVPRIDPVWRLVEIRDGAGNSLSLGYEVVWGDWRIDAWPTSGHLWFWPDPSSNAVTPATTAPHVRLRSVTDTRGVTVYYHYRHFDEDAGRDGLPQDANAVVCEPYDYHYGGDERVLATQICRINPFLDCVSLSSTGCFDAYPNPATAPLLRVHVGWGSEDPSSPAFNAGWGELSSVTDTSGRGHSFGYLHTSAESEDWLGSPRAAQVCEARCADGCTSICEIGHRACDAVSTADLRDPTGTVYDDLYAQCIRSFHEEVPECRRVGSYRDCVPVGGWLSDPVSCDDEFHECVDPNDDGSPTRWNCTTRFYDHGDQAYCEDRCMSRLSPPSGFAYGAPSELAHKLTRITNSDGQLILEQQWGANDQEPSYAHVTHQWTGPERAPITVSYADLTFEQSVSTEHVPPYGGAVELCPEVLGGSVRTYGAARTGSAAPELFRAVTTRDVHGTYATDYLDEEGHVLRRIVFSDTAAVADEVTDYEFAGPNRRLSGVRSAGGQRQCMAFDERGQLVQSTVLAATGRPGSAEPQVTLLGYEANGLLREVASGPAADLARVTLERDSLGRVTRQTVLASASAVPRVTRYEYDASEYPTDRYESYDPTFTPSFQWRARPVVPTLPTAVIHDTDGTIERYRQYSLWSGAPRVVEVADESGRVLQDARYSFEYFWGEVRRSYRADPEYGETRFAYDAVRRLSRVQQSVVAGSDTYPAGTLLETSYEYPNETTVRVTTGWRDSALHLTDLREIRTDVFGNQVWDGPQSPTPTPEARTACARTAWDGRVSRTVLPEGNGVEVDYDFAGRVRSTRMGDLGSDVLAVVGCGLSSPRASRPRSVEEVVRYEYGPGGVLAATTAGGVRSSYVSDGFGRIIGAADPSGLWLRRGYDSRGRLSWEAAYDGRSLPTSGGAYDATFLRPTGRGGALVSMSEYRYDASDRLQRVTQWRLEDTSGASDVWFALEYDDAHRRVVTRSGDGTTSTLEQDALGRSVRALDPNGTELLTAYGPRWVEERITGEPVWTRTELDGLERPVRVVRHTSSAPLGETVLEQHYDQVGRIDRRSYLGSGTEHFRYDDWNQLVEQWTDFGAGAASDEVEPRLGYEYDLNGQLTALSRYRGIQPFTTEYEYDGLGRMFRRTDADGRVSRVDDFVDGTSRPLQTFDTATGTRRTVVYDAAGRPYVTTTWGNRVETYGTRLVNFYTVMSQLQSTQLLHFGLDSQGRAHPVPSHTVGFQYDSLGNLRTQTDSRGAGYQVSHTTDPYGRFRTTSYGGVSFTHRFDAVGRLQGVELGSELIASYEYDRPTTGPTSIWFGDETIDRRQYDELGQLRSLWVERYLSYEPLRSEQVLYRATAYGANGIPQLVSTAFRAGADQTDAFAVDPAGRLVAESLGLAGVQVPAAGTVDPSSVSSLIGQGRDWRRYDLDGTGNWRINEGPHDSLAMSVGEVDEYLSSAGSAATTPFLYDADGNVTQWGGLRFQYDSDRHPIDVSGPGGHASFRYDAFGRRMQEVADSGTTDIVWDGGEILAMHEGNAAAGNSWLRISGATADSTVALVNLGTGARRYFHQDEANSTLAVTDRSSGLLEGYQYSAWGELADEGGNPMLESDIGNRFLHHGALFDPWTQTYSLRAREYAPQFGRFLSQDPIGHAGGANVYAFGGGRYDVVDPSGLSPRQAQQRDLEADELDQVMRAIDQRAAGDSLPRGPNRAAHHPDAGIPLPYGWTPTWRTGLLNTELCAENGAASYCTPITDPEFPYQGHLVEFIRSQSEAGSFAWRGRGGAGAGPASGRTATTSARPPTPRTGGATAGPRTAPPPQPRPAGDGPVTALVPYRGALPPRVRIVSETSSYTIYEAPGGRLRARFRAAEARVGGRPRPGRNGTLDAEVAFDEQGRLTAYEGMHRTVGAGRYSDVVDPRAGGVPDAPGWLDFPFDPRPAAVGRPLWTVDIDRVAEIPYEDAYEGF